MLNLTQEQRDLIIGSIGSVDSLEVFWRLHPDLNLDAAIGGVAALQSGTGQTRTTNLEAPGEPSDEYKAAAVVVNPQLATEPQTGPETPPASEG